MKILTRKEEGIWQVVITSPTGQIEILCNKRRDAAIFADLLVTLIRGFGPNDVSRVH